MGIPLIQFPLSLRPVVRSRERGVAEGASMPYHPAIWIVDSTGRRITDVAPDPDDIRAGRLTRDPHQLVSRASQTVMWLQGLHDRLRAWTDTLECPPDLIVRPIIAVEPSGTHVETGVQFCSAPDDEFDRITQRVEILAHEDELSRTLEPIRDRMLRRHSRNTHKRVQGHMATKGTKTLGRSQREELLVTMKARFEKHMLRHNGLQWENVRLKLESDTDKLRSLNEMERSGGEPDVIGQDEKTGEYLFVDCSAESPKGRRSVCYDREALEARKKHKPDASAVELAAAMGAVLLTEQEYRRLQKLGEFDTTTSSWLQTPPDIRRLGGAIFGDYRFGTVWVYHNGAESYYAARGFRCALRV